MKKKKKKKIEKWFADDNCPICRLMREKDGDVSLEELQEAFEDAKSVPGAIVGTGADLDKIETTH